MAYRESQPHQADRTVLIRNIEYPRIIVAVNDFVTALLDDVGINTASDRG
jgi:hypothetical protein